MPQFSEVDQSQKNTVSGTLDEVATYFAGQKEAGAVEWENIPDYAYDENNAITSNVVRVNIYLRMPEWTDYGEASPAAQQEWTRFFNALMTHEQGHIDRVKAFYTDAVDQELVGKPLGDAATWTTGLKDRSEASHKTYDHETDHGRKFGTIITPPLEDESAETEPYTEDPMMTPDPMMSEDPGDSSNP